jgi:trk system potassium uptake protein
MQIIILGAGQVGTGMARSLSQEDFDITVVDTDAVKLRELQEKLDIRTVLGHGAHPQTLIRAGIEDAELLIALTNSDETNMVACQVAYSLFNTPTKVARVRAADYLAHPELFKREHAPIDVLISPEGWLPITSSTSSSIRVRCRCSILLMAAPSWWAPGRTTMDHWWGMSSGSLREKLPDSVDARVAAIFRNDEPIIPKGDTVIEVDDIVYFLAARDDIPVVMRELRRMGGPANRIMLAGGGNIGAALALRLERSHHVKLVERDAERAEIIAEDLDTTIVLVGDCADEDLLHEEGIDEIDVFCALTNDDEANILSSMLAKRMGADKVITLINRPAYVDLVESDRIDVAVSPQQVTIGALLTHIRRGHMVRVHSLGAARPRPSRRSPTAGRASRRWSAGASRKSTCRPIPPSVASFVART